MNWLDLVVAAPTVGLLFDEWHKTTDEYVKAATPLLRKMSARLRDRPGKNEVTVAADGPLGLQVNDPTGHIIKFDHKNVISQFTIPMEVQDRAGKLPELTFDGLEPFSKKLDEVLTYLTDAVGAVQSIGNQRKLVRVGLVAQCRLDGESLPPGIERFVNHTASPWGRPLQKLNADLLAVLGEDDDGRVVSRCHHHLDLTVDRLDGRDVRLKLDWQRFWYEPYFLPQGSEKRMLELQGLCAEGMEYFNRFAMGDLNYG